MRTQKGGQMMVFHGEPFQRGYGLGSFFQSLARKAIPLLKTGAKTVGKAALNTGVNIAKDILTGNNLKDSAKARLRQSAQTLKQQALNQFTSQAGSGRSRIRKTQKRKAPQKKLSLPRAGKAKRPRIVLASDDIFKP